MLSEPAGPNDQLARIQEDLDTANRKLAEAHKMASLGRLAAGIVHEINTPIGSIFSNNEVILRSLDKLKQTLSADPDANGKALAMLETISSLAAVDKIACERIGGIVRSLKTFARVNEADLQKVDINDLLRNTIKLTSTVFRRRISMETDFGEVPEAECFPGLLNQVFLNLVVNAGQAIEGEGCIGVKTRAEGGTIHVAIHDSGKGIPPEVQSKIFAAGFTTKPLGEGTGLGLTITREIVEDTHRGKIYFESEVGHGATFHVVIPVHQKRS